MGYGKEVYQSAITLLNEKRQRENEEAEERKNVFYTMYPRAQEIQRLLSSTAIQAARAVLNGGNTAEQLKQLKEHNLALQKEFQDLLRQAGLPENYLEPHYCCEKCQDTGYIDGRMCQCLKELLRKEAYRRLNEMTPLSLCTFDSFSLEYYPETAENANGVSPKRQMENVFRYCKNYSQNFSLSSPSLILQGGTGLGKTHLSLSIASEVIDKGYGVIYGSSQNIATTLERERFSRDSDDETNRLLLGCDLLILDDLGTEFSTSFVEAAVYNIINTRLMAQRPTIISTNLSFLEMQKRYSERFVSRIIGSYIRLQFYGKDVRQQKRMKQ